MKLTVAFRNSVNVLYLKTTPMHALIADSKLKDGTVQSDVTLNPSFSNQGSEEDHNGFRGVTA